MKLFDNDRIEGNKRLSGSGDAFIRIINALGSFGFGWIIGPVLLDFLPFPTWLQSAFAGVLVGGVFDYMLIVWTKRVEIDDSSKEQIRHAKTMRDFALWGSTTTTAIFFLFMLVPSHSTRKTRKWSKHFSGFAWGLFACLPGQSRHRCYTISGGKTQTRKDSGTGRGLPILRA